jgi:hypothetical protein
MSLSERRTRSSKGALPTLKQASWSAARSSSRAARRRGPPPRSAQQLSCGSCSASRDCKPSRTVQRASQLQLELAAAVMPLPSDAAQRVSGAPRSSLPLPHTSSRQSAAGRSARSCACRGGGAAPCSLAGQHPACRYSCSCICTEARQEVSGSVQPAHSPNRPRRSCSRPAAHSTTHAQKHTAARLQRAAAACLILAAPLQRRSVRVPCLVGSSQLAACAALAIARTLGAPWRGGSQSQCNPTAAPLPLLHVICRRCMGNAHACASWSRSEMQSARRYCTRSQAGVGDATRSLFLSIRPCQTLIFTSLQASVQLEALIARCAA